MMGETVDATVMLVGGVKLNAAPVDGLISDCVQAAPDPEANARVMEILAPNVTHTLRRSATADLRAYSTAAFS